MPQGINQHILICRYVVLALLPIPSPFSGKGFLPIAPSLRHSLTPAQAAKVRSTRDFSHIQNEIETLRGKKFLRQVPVYEVSEKELRATSDREIDKQYPGPRLGHY